MNPWEGLFWPMLEGLTIPEARQAAVELEAVAVEASYRVRALEGREDNLTAREELQNLVSALQHRARRYMSFVQFIQSNQ